MNATEIFAAVQGMDPALKRTDHVFMVASVLMAARVHGADEVAISELLDFAPEYVVTVGSRLRGNGVWSGLETLMDDASSGVEFWMLCCVADGTMQCSYRDGERLFSLTPAGRRAASPAGGAGEIRDE